MTTHAIGLGLVAMGCYSCLLAEEKLVFSFFRNNGEDGVYLAESRDGLKWTESNGGLPVLKPEVGEAKLTRDPSIARGPNGVYHMVWTTAWKGRTIGYATSRDLKTWSAQRAIVVFPEDTAVLNCWAPEVFYDARRKDFVVVWASTITGKFPETAGQAGKEYNHRLYSFRTKDFVAIGSAKLFYEPGFNVIDGALFREGNRYAMVVKNETQNPPAKYLYLTYANSLNGPWTHPGRRISGVEWAEGASPVKIGKYWYVYFDKYRDHKYGAVRSMNLEDWEDVSARVELPKGARHGTVFWMK